jgi:arabinan endo-1,5-alpha-L-arabinosidase
MIKITRALTLLALFLMGCQPIAARRFADQALLRPTATATAQTNQGILLEPTGFIQRIHDPVIAKEGDTYYVFSTGSRLIVICSQDLIEWVWCGRVFAENPAWLTAAVPGVADLWAPDISYFAGK